MQHFLTLSRSQNTYNTFRIDPLTLGKLAHTQNYKKSHSIYIFVHYFNILINYHSAQKRDRIGRVPYTFYGIQSMIIATCSTSKIKTSGRQIVCQGHHSIR